MGDRNKSVDLSETLRVLASPYRRYILYLMTSRKIDTIDELIPVISEMITSELVDENRTTIQLQQIHLPKLRDAGFIDYDPRNGEIILQKDSEELRDLLETIQQWEDPAIRTKMS